MPVVLGMELEPEHAARSLASFVLFCFFNLRNGLRLRSLLSLPGNQSCSKVARHTSILHESDALLVFMFPCDDLRCTCLGRGPENLNSAAQRTVCLKA